MKHAKHNTTKAPAAPELPPEVRPGQSIELLAPAGLDAARVLVVGAGKPEELDAQGVENAAASAFRAVQASGVKELLIRFPSEPARAALGVRLGAYRFDRYRTTEKADKKPSV